MEQKEDSVTECPAKLDYLRAVISQESMYPASTTALEDFSTKCDLGCSGPVAVPRTILGVELPISKSICSQDAGREE